MRTLHKKLFVSAVLLAVGAAAFSALYFEYKEKTIQLAHLRSVSVDLLESTVSEAPPVFEPGQWESVAVVRVIDGDTVELTNGDRLRLIGIDAPERGACFADESAAILEQAVSGHGLQLEPGVNERDRYGRRLGYLHDGTTFINELLVSRGAAIAKTFPPDVVYAEGFLREEEQAKTSSRGLWGLCGTLQESGQIDVITEEQAPPSPECSIKGNISSSGERIYHLSGCGSYSKTKVDVRAGERWFCSEEEAEAAGWRKAQNCPS